jgi:hypothetical protein
LYFSQLALSFHKIGGVSEVKMKKRIFHFVLLSTCTIFAPKKSTMHIKLNHLLTFAVILLAVVAYLSVSRPLRFEEQREQREQTVKERLAIIRNAAERYHADSGHYASSFDQLVGARYLVDSLRIIPFSDGETFHLSAIIRTTPLGGDESLMECGAEYAQYLKGLPEEEVSALTEEALTRGAYPGVCIGSLTENNHNAGNWE